MHFGFQVLNLQEVEARFFLESENDGEQMLAMLAGRRIRGRRLRRFLGRGSIYPVKELATRLSELLVLSQLRNRGTMVEVKAMPVDLDIEENQLFIMGERRGVAKTLIKMLEHRFGPLSEALQKRIKSADRSALDRWVDRMDQGFPLESIFTD